MMAHYYFDETGIFTVVEAFTKVLKRGIIEVNKMIRISEWLKKKSWFLYFCFPVQFIYLSLSIAFTSCAEQITNRSLRV